MSIESESKRNHKVVISPQISCYSEFDTGEHDVFIVTEDGPDFRGVSMIGAAVLIAKSQMGLGVLGIPQTFQSLGFVPGLVSLISLCLISTWTGYIVGKFRIRHPSVYSLGDATEMMFGSVGRELMGGAFWLFYTLCYGASLLTFSISLNTLSHHSSCTMAWVGIGAAISLVLGLGIRTMKVMSWCGYLALSCIMISVWIVAIACLTQKTPAAAPKGLPIDKGIVATSSNIPYSSIASATATQVLSLAGTASFFTIHSEMRDQKQYVKSLLLGQGSICLNYVIIGCFIYAKVGNYVTSPALGSAGLLFKKIGYGIAIPGLLFSCFFQAHLAGKYSFVRILRNTRHLQLNTIIHWTTWVILMLVAVCVGFVVAGGIPFFNDLLALIGALIGTSFTMIVPGFLALYELGKYRPKDGDGRFAWLVQSKRKWGSNKKNMITASVAIFTIVFGSYIAVSGIYGSVKSIIDGYRNGLVPSAFHALIIVKLYVDKDLQIVNKKGCKLYFSHSLSARNAL